MREKEKKADRAAILSGVIKIWFARSVRGDLDKARADVYCESLLRFAPTEREWSACVDHFVDSDGFFPHVGEIRQHMEKVRAEGAAILARSAALRETFRSYTPWTAEQIAEREREKARWSKIGKMD